MLSSQMAQRAAQILNSGLQTATPLSGGDLSPVLAIRLSDGRCAVAKGSPSPRAEAAMLAAIAKTGTPAPCVLGADENVLVLERLEESGGLSSEGWNELGHALRRMHAAQGQTYGWDEDYAFADVPISNAPCPNWPTFWATRRLLPETTHLPAPFAARLERLAKDLPNRLPESPIPSLLHGDLWTGNVLARNGRLAGLIDPACSYGHAEVDIAMLRLFGAPPTDFDRGYGGFDHGIEQRRPIYQLWPAIVHVRLFGAGYHPMLDRLLSQNGV